MENINLLAMLVYSLINFTAIFMLFHLRRINPAFWFLCFQWIIAIGTLYFLDFGYKEDVLYAILFFISLLAFLLGTTLSMGVFSIRRRFTEFFNKPIQDDNILPKICVIILVFISLFVTIIYYRAVGYNLFADLIFGREIADFKSARLASYAGINYYAPGYVNQFKNILLPTGLFVFCAWLWFSGKRNASRILCLVSIPVCLYALLGTGQRAPLLYSTVGLMFGYSSIKRMRLRWVLVISIGAVSFFGIFSLLNQRIEQLNPYSVLQQLISRVFVNEQLEGLLGFRHVLNLKFSAFSDWINGLMGIFPKHRGSTLPHELYYLLHGTSRGTSGLTTVGSAFYNGGVFTLLAFYLLLGFLYTYAYKCFLSGRRTILRSITYGGLFFVLAVYVTGPPVVILNKGLMAYVLLLFIEKFNAYRITIMKKEAVSPYTGENIISNE